MNKYAATIPGVIALVLGVICLMRTTGPQPDDEKSVRLREDCRGNHQQLEKRLAEISQLLEQERADRETLQIHVDRLRFDLEELKTSGIASADAMENPDEHNKAQLKKAKEQDKFEENIDKRNRAFVKMRYIGLEEQMTLDADQREALEDALAKRMAYSMKLQTLEAVPEEQRELTLKEVQKVRREIDEWLREALGADNFQIYKNAAKTREARVLMDQVRKRLTKEIDPDGLEQLSKILEEEHANFKFTKDLLDWENPILTVTDEEKATYAAEREKLDTQIITRIQEGKLLGEEQLGMLQKHMEARRKMQISGHGPPWERPAWGTGGPPPWAGKFKEKK